MKRIILFTLFTVLFSTKISAAVWYVNINATGANNGTSWADAYTDLQDGIAASAFGDEIWVAAGTYKPTSTTDRNISFAVKNGTKVYGGFNGTETVLSDRNITLNVTVLSGEIGTGAANDNSYRVVRFNNVANQTRLDGFTITGGYNSVSMSYGGGIVSVNSSPVIANCIVMGNFAAEGGGGLNHSGSGALTIEGCIFDGNVGNTYGGGALRLYAGPVNISNCYFKSNQSNTYGGAIFVYGALVNITNSVFAGNIAQSTGSAIRIGDVGIFHLSNSLVVGNYTNGNEVIYASTFSNSGEHTIKNTTIAHNKQANSSGGSNPSAVALNKQASITNSIIYGNSNSIQVLGTGLTFSHNITQSASSSASGTNILYKDPLFTLSGDVNNAPFDTTGLNYHVSVLSPGIDFGLNANVQGTSDLAGNPRIQNTTVDLGAYEAGFCVSPLTLSPSAPYVICGGSPITLTVNNATDYLWSTGSTNSSITVSSAGSYSVIFEDENGCRGTAQATVASSSLPNPVITFSGGTLNAGNFASYQWYFNGVPISGSTSNTHVPLEGYGTYSVDVTNNAGCSSTGTFCLSPANLTASGPVSFCQGESVTLTVNNGTNQVWSTGSLDSEITVSTSGTYSVTVSNVAAGCSVNLQQAVTVNNNPAPVINLSGGNLTTQSYASYQWNYNGTPISGATSQTLIPTENGEYTVTVTNASGCTGTSQVYNLDNVGLENITEDAFLFYPNPVKSNGTLNFSWGKQYTGKAYFRIYDLTGAVVFDLRSEEFPESIVLPDLKSGVYFIDIESLQNRRLKLIIL
ncbi:MAG: T9SS type A sorting domain-containing protein [Flavobacteriia bacterium]|nr:T9SS type A sorting domain-containing protein [Flavobacteriia bacterium]OJX34954.1 MAG: hypothetical protein BGO87_09455 [Flavobacteriia bacterium 40-80]